jgi:hypothetical protein
MDEKKRQPAFVIAILALLGATSLPQMMRSQGGIPPPGLQQKEAAQPPARAAGPIEVEEKDADRRDLGPLLQYLSEGGTGAVGAGDLRRCLAAKYPAIPPKHRKDRLAKDPSVHCLIVTLPEPVASVASARFDEFLDIVQRAVELQGFILDRSHLPWQPVRPGPAGPPDRVTRVHTGGIGLELQVETTASPEPRYGRPGLIVFKQALPRPGQDPTVLLVFVVPESPIHGIDKAAFARSLELIDRYFYGQLTWEPPAAPGRCVAGGAGGQAGPRRIVHIVAPCFDSSQRSLEVAVGDWKDPGARPYHFRILSNNAGQIDRERIRRVCREDPRRRVSFCSMVHETTTVGETMIRFLNDKLGYDPAHVALLIESNSGLVQALAERVWKNQLADEFVFPLQVAEVRKAYEKQGLLGPGGLSAAGAPERLTIPPDESGEPVDLPRAYTPSSSAAFDEMALTQVLTTIGHRRYHAVGIIASNPFDVVFLARRVRRFCPNVRLFAIQADLLFARPENVGDLRGMLVASTYSLYPANQWVTTPYGATPRVLFSDQGGQGLYNAIVAHLWEMDLVRGTDGQRPGAPPLLDFGMPYKEDGTRGGPPVWIGSVGERGIFPVASVEAPKDGTYLYDCGCVPDDRRAVCQAISDGRGEPQRLKAMRPNAHILYWFLCLLLFFACFAVAGLTWAYIRWSTDPEKKVLRPRVAGVGFGHVLRALNCEIAPRGYHGDTYDPQARFREPGGNPCPYPPPLGAGIYLLLINLLVLGVSYYFFSYLLVAMRPHMGHMSRWIYVSYAVSLTSVSLISASSALAFLDFLGARGFLRRGRYVFFPAVILLAAVWWWAFFETADVPPWRLDFERISNLPSGVSPLFPLIFLAGAIGCWIESQLARRRLYRLSYLLATSPEGVPREPGSQPEKRLREMRMARKVVDRLITGPAHAVMQVHPALPWGLLLLFLLLFIRTGTRGMPRSFEGFSFDRAFWALFVVLITLLVVQTLQLLALWGRIRQMLELAVTLPMAHAFDRIPQRFRSWFFGARDFHLREELVLQQSAALKSRATPELATIYQKVFPRAEGYWAGQLEQVRESLDDPRGTLDSTRSVYPLLDPVWDSLPVEETRLDRPKQDERGSEAEWVDSWPLMPQDRHRANLNERRILRDWAQMAEDLVALQIVRSFAPASSQLLPIMRSLVMGSLLLLLAITSYPFDHSGWLMTVMVALILLIAWSVGTVVVGTNRDELISRVSDTAPGRLSPDGGFVASLATTIGPLLGALLAISFDLADLLHTWFGPIFQLL